MSELRNNKNHFPHKNELLQKIKQCETTRKAIIPPLLRESILNT